MATPGFTLTFEELKSQLAKKQYAPIYLLHGEEGYFIDELVKLFEDILPVEEQAFNLYTMYAPQVSADDVMDACRRYPMMSEYQVVILKEAQVPKIDYLNKLHAYASNPSPSTILVICARGALVNPKDLLAEMKKNKGIVFESNRVKSSNMNNVIATLINSKGLKVDQKSLSMLSDFIGNDLSRMYNEIEKLALVIEPNGMITPEAIERNIGVSKDFNNFELVNAIAQKDSLRVYRIIEYFRANPKNNPPLLTVSQLFKFFSNLLLIQFAKDKSEKALLDELGFKFPWQLNDYRFGIRNYNAFKTIEIISAIRAFDSMSKGVDSRQNEFDLLKTLMFKILSAEGNIVI